MKIIFNPFYCERPFSGDKSLFNTVTVGKSGLLSELELRAGLTAVLPSHTERVVAFINAAQSAINATAEHNLFFKESFDTDKFGTAEVLLGWRDNLVYAGWTADVNTTDKLRGLAAIENHFKSHGEADRWRQLLDYVKTHTILKPDDEIEVTASQKHLDNTLQQLLSYIKQRGVRITFAPDSVNGSDIPNPTLRHFHTDIEAHTWMAQQQLTNNDVVAGFDNAVMADLARAINIPAEASQETGMGSQMQMLNLGLALFKQPIDAQALLNYLQLPQSPLRSVYHEKEYKSKEGTYLRPLSEELKDVLLEGGLGQKWQDTLDMQLVDFYHEKVDIKRILPFINMWKKSTVSEGKCYVNKDDVVDYIESLRKWCAQRQMTDKPIHIQFSALVSACKDMLLLLESQAQQINADDLLLWVSKIMQPVTLSDNAAQAGSQNLIALPTDICTEVDNLYWLCSSNNSLDIDPYEFLGTNDKQALSDAGICLPEQGDSSLFLQDEILRGLSRAKNIHLITCDIRNGEEVAPNSVAMQIMHTKTVERPDDTDNRNLEEKDAIGLWQQQYTYHVDKSKFADLNTPRSQGGLRRESESYSSLNTLIQTPFEYVLQYLLDMKDYQSDALSDVDTVKGTVAHKYIEQLTKENNCNPDVMRRMHNDNYDNIIAQIIEETGVLLLQENNQLELKSLKNQLRESVDILLDIITKNQLTIIGSEYEAEAEFDHIGKMYAKVDYLLQTRDGKLVIFDFKWSESSFYKKKLESNLALQLAVYKNILTKAFGKEVVFWGYYQLPKHKMLTSESTLSNANIVIVEPNNNNDIFAQAINSYCYRLEQLQNGLIEEGEMLELANLQYAKDAAQFNLYPLDETTDDDNKKIIIKDTPYGEPNKVLKGRLK